MACGLPGTLIELATMGNLDRALMSSVLAPDTMTLWRSVIGKISPFAREVVEQTPTQGTVAAGNTGVVFAAPKHADIITNVYARVTMPGIGLWRNSITAGGSLTGTLADALFMDAASEVASSGTPTFQEPRWAPYAPIRFLKNVTMVVGSHEFDVLKDHAIWACEELMGKPGRELHGHREGRYTHNMAGGAYGSGTTFHRHSQTFYIPLPFSFTAGTGVALPAVSFQLHSISFKIDFAPLADLFFVNTATDAYTASGGNVRVRPDITKTLAASPKVLEASDIGCALEFMVVILDEEERTRFAMGHFETLMTDHKYKEYRELAATTSPTSSTPPQSFRHNTKFSNGVREVILLCRRSAHETYKQWYNFNGLVDSVSGYTREPLLTIGQEFSNSARFPEKTALFYRLAFNHDSHSKIPLAGVYTFQYGVDPEDTESTGHVNMTRLESCETHGTIDPRVFGLPLSGAGGHAGAEASTYLQFLYIARAYNILRASAGFSNKRFL